MIGGLWRAMYTLQVVDGILFPPDGSEPNREWTQRFVSTGGPAAVLTLTGEFAALVSEPAAGRVASQV